MNASLAVSALAAAASLALATTAQAAATVPGDLLVTASTYVDPGFSIGAALPISTGATATAGSAFCGNANCSVSVWNNGSVDANFGISSGITLKSLNPGTGALDASLDVTALAAAQGLSVVTSFASKSELAINVTPDGSGLTFMAYQSSTGKLDISNSQAPGTVNDPGNNDTATPTARSVVQLTLGTQKVQQTLTTAYSGNNGRAAVLGSNGSYYTAGNAGNGGNGTAQVTGGTGVQIFTPGAPATQDIVGTYSITQNGYAADKTAKDNNFRGLTVFNNTVYVSKGSGGNGIDTVYQVGTTGSLPTGGNTTPISILPGFNTTLASATTTPHPFGIFFANASTLYVADEGSGLSTDFGPNPTTMVGGLQKYSLVGGVWELDYTLKGSLIGSSYTVNGSGSLAGSSLSTTTDGLRNITGKVNPDGTVTLYAVTSTAGSNLADAGADPNKVVAITDTLSFTSAAQAASEDFTTLETAQLGEVLRGVALAPTAAVPEPGSVAMMLAGLGLLGRFMRRRAPQ
jgi:hypothetical protein